MTSDLFIKQNIFLEDNKIILSDDFLSFLKSKITDERRYNHSLSVALLCYEVAKANKLENPLLYYFAGVIHDVGKNFDKIKGEEVIDKYYHEYIDYPKYAYHQFIGEYILMHDLTIFDNDVLNAVKYHCTGRKLMSPIEKIIYACDKIDPLRGFDSSSLIKAMKDDWKSGFKVVLKANYDYLLSKVKLKKDLNGIFNELSAECFKYYLGIERRKELN